LVTIDGSQLSVADGNDITLNSGDIEITNGGAVRAPDGIINISSIKSAGEIATDQQQTDFDTFPELGFISINDASTVSATGAYGGRIVIRGGQLVVDNSSIAADTEVFSIQTAANIDINTRDSIAVDNGGKISADLKMFADGAPTGIYIKTDDLNINNGSSIQALTEFLSFGNAGDIDVSADFINIDNYSKISTSTFSTGDSGDITINNSDTIKISNASSINSAADWLFGEGKSGDISISTNNLNITGLENPFDIAISDFTGINAGLSIINGNDAGNINVKADNIILDQNAAISSWTSGGFKSGDIIIQSHNLNIKGGSYIQTYSSDNGLAGAIDIDSDEVMISGVSPNPDALFGSYNFSRIVRIGGGESDISLRSKSIYVLDGGKILSESFLSNFSSGNIRMHANEIIISGVNELAYENSMDSGNDEATALNEAQSLLSSSIYAQAAEENHEGTENAGSIFIDANEFALAQGAGIRANSDGFESSDQLKESGNIDIAFKNGSVSGSTISASSFAANGGNISLTGSGSLLLQDATISASVQSATGNGGNVDTKSNFLLLDGSSITATAIGGIGGNITLSSKSMLISDNNIVDASSELSVNGTVQIKSELYLNKYLEKLPETKIEPDSQFAQNCQLPHLDSKSTLSNKIESQFIVSNSLTTPSSYNYNIVASKSALSLPNYGNNQYEDNQITINANKCAYKTAY